MPSMLISNVRMFRSESVAEGYISAIFFTGASESLTVQGDALTVYCGAFKHHDLSLISVPTYTNRKFVIPGFFLAS